MTILFEDVLNKYMTQRETLTPKERDALWCYVNNYIVGLSKKLFKQHNYQNRRDEREVTRHDYRVMAFYDFIDYAVGKGRGARWVLMVFKMRFPDLEGLLMLKATGVAYVDDIIKAGISTALSRRATRLAAARRNCAKALKRSENIGFEDYLPCLVKTGASAKVVATWKRHHDRAALLAEMSQPLPLLPEIARIKEEIDYD